MSEPTRAKDRDGAWISVWVTAVLTAAFAVAVGCGVWMALGREDTETSESTLILSVARQLVLGPWGLYGPYDAHNHLVLIHAPLYYRLAALLAWPLKSAGLDVVSAARLAGRSLSLLGLGITAWSAYRIARFDGAPKRAGWWAACLIASVPVVGTMPFAVRPDMLGVGLQTTGVMLVLGALRSERPSGRVIAGAFAAFGLAMCIKQAFVSGPIVSTILLLWARRRGARARIGLGLLVAFTIVAADYVIEELVTGGRMSQAVFVAAAEMARAHPGGWDRAGIVFIAIIAASSFPIVLMTAAGLAQFTAKPGGVGRVALGWIGTMLVGLVLVMGIVQVFRVSAYESLISVLAVFTCLFLIIPACTFIDPRCFFANRLDASVCLFLGAETVIVVFLCEKSAGAWINYGIQAMVFAAILTARCVARCCDVARSRRTLLPIALASLAVLGVAIQEAYASVVRIRVERRLGTHLVRVLSRPSSELYFVGGPGRNRLYGNVDLVYDDWLYPYFESMGLAELRSSWLEHALASGSIRFVINGSEGPRVEGLGRPLTALGYIPRYDIDVPYVWEHVRKASPQ